MPEDTISIQDALCRKLKLKAIETYHRIKRAEEEERETSEDIKGTSELFRTEIEVALWNL